MAGKVDVRISGKEAAILESYTRVIRRQGKMLAQQRQIAREAKKGGETAKTSHASWESGIAGVITRYASMAAAVAAVTMALREQSQAAQEASNRIGQMQSALGAAAFSSPSQFSKAQYQNLLQQIGAETLTPATEMSQLGAKVGSSAAGMTPGQVVSALRESAKIGALSTDLPAAAFGEAALTMMRVTGARDARPALGFLAQTARAVQISDPAEVAGTLPVAMRNITQLGGITAEEAAELFAYINKSAVNPLGQRAVTAGVSFASRLFLEDTIPVYDETTGKVRYDFLANVAPQVQKTGTLNEALGFVRNQIAGLPPEARAEAFKKFQVGKGETRISTYGLIGEVPESMDLYRTIQSEVTPPGPGSEANLAEIENYIKSTPGYANQQAARTRLYATEQAQRANPRAALAADIWGAYREQVANLPEGMGGLLVGLRSMAVRATAGTLMGRSPEQAIAQLERLQNEALGYAGLPFYGAPEATQRQFYDRLESLIETFTEQLREVNRQLGEGNQERRRQTGVIQDPAGPNGASTRATAVDVAAENR